MNELKQLVYPLGPVPRTRERRRTYSKLLKAQYEENGIDVNWDGVDKYISKVD